MTDKPETGRTFTEGEAYALVDQAVVRETADAKTKIEGLETKVAELSSKVDVLETEKAQAVQRADVAEKALADDKAEREAAAERETKRTERLKQVAEANPLLPLQNEDGTPHERADRIVAMSDESFENYLADMREVASKAPAAGDTTKDGLPRESAAFGGDGGKDPATPQSGGVKGLFAARHKLQSA